MHTLLWIPIFAAMLVSCADDKKKKKKNTTNNEEESAAEVIPGISGEMILQIGSTKTDGDGFRLWMFEKSGGGFLETKINSGSYFVNASNLNAGGEYSFFLADADYNLIGPLDFDDSTSGSQNTLKFDSATTSTIGKLTVSYSKYGTIDSALTTLSSSLPSGFSLSSTSQIAFNDVASPSDLKDFRVGHVLNPANEREILFGFYQSATYTQRYLNSLTQSSSVKFSVKSNKDLTMARLTGVGEWASGSTTLEGISGTLPSEKWGDLGYSISYSEKEAMIRIKSGVNIESNAAVLLSYATDSEASTVPQQFSYFFTHPPKVMTYASDATTFATIDYADLSVDNGLTSPLDIAATKIALRVEPPRDLDGSLIGESTIGTVVLKMNYFTYDGSILKATDVAAEKFASSYQKSNTLTADSTGARYWDIGDRTLTYTLSGGLADNAHIFTIEKEMLLDSTLAPKIKIEIRYIDGVNETQTSVWLEQ